MFPSQTGGRATIARQQIKELRQSFRVEAETRRQLPENRPKLLAKRQHTRGEEIGQGRFDVAQFFHVRDEPAAFHRKNKIRWRRLVPTAITRGSLQRVKRAVDLHGIERAAGKFELAVLWQIFRVKLSAPAGVSPTRNADAKVAGRTMLCGAVETRPNIPRLDRVSPYRFVSYTRLNERSRSGSRLCFAHILWNWRRPSFSCSPKVNRKCFS